MWIVKKLNRDAVIYLLSEKHAYIVGRKDCDLVLDEDSSISRKHVTLFVAKREECDFSVETSTGLWIVDENSRYGTHLRNGKEWEKLNAGEEKVLSHGCIIKFGLFENVWRVEYHPVIACTSGLQNDEKAKIETLLKSIDGELRIEWSKDCTLVIVNEIILTCKVVLALINGIPIVKTDYLSKLVDSVRNQTSIPDCGDYRPVIKETVLDASLVLLDSHKTRKELFKGLTFVFPTKKQLETLKEVVSEAGGKTELLPYTGNWNKLSGRNFVLIQLPKNKLNIPEKLNHKFKEITTFLESNYGKRIVPESEIALAIAYSSTEKYCNSMSKSYEGSASTEKPDLGTVLVEETPEVTQGFVSDAFMVPCSFVEDSQDSGAVNANNFLTGRKRILSPDNGEPQSKISRNEEDFNYLKNQNSRESRQSELDDEEQEEQQEEDEPRLNFCGDSLKSKGSQKNVAAEKNSSKVNSIANYFEKQRNPSSRESQQNELNPKRFDNFLSTEGDKSNKRKLPSSTVSTEENVSTKKFKFPFEIRRKNVDSNSPSNRFDCHSNNAMEEVESPEMDSSRGFIEKDKTKSIISQSGTVNGLNNTMFSLTLISSVYLKEDGSLIDPPEVLVNVKKFKKQKICTVENSQQTEQMDKELFGTDWIEVHPVKSEKNWW